MGLGSREMLGIIPLRSRADRRPDGKSGHDDRSPSALSAEAMLVRHDHVFHRVKHLKVEDWTKAA
jgi:hypothetical protein